MQDQNSPTQLVRLLGRLVFSFVVAAALSSCASETESPAYRSGYAKGHEIGQAAGYAAGESSGIQKSYAEVQAAAKDQGYKEGYAKGYNEGEDAALPSGWSPTDSLAKFIFGASSIVGGIFIAIKILVFGFVLVDSAKTGSGSVLNFSTMIIFSLAAYFAFRIFGIEPALVGLAVFPTPPSAGAIALIVFVAAAITFGLIIFAEFLHDAINGPVGLMILSAAHGIFSTIIITIGIYTLKLDFPLGHTIVLIGMGIFFGTSFYGLRILLLNAISEERDIAKKAQK